MIQGSLFEGYLRKVTGQERVLATCEEIDPAWVDHALEIVRDLARQGKRFTADDVRANAGHLAKPPHHNAWGAMFSKALNLGIIRRCGHVKARHSEAHGRVVGLWCAPGTEHAVEVLR